MDTNLSTELFFECFLIVILRPILHSLCIFSFLIQYILCHPLLSLLTLLREEKSLN